MAINTGPYGMGGANGGNYGQPRQMGAPAFGGGPTSGMPNATPGGIPQAAPQQQKKHRGFFGSLGHALAAPAQFMFHHDPLARGLAAGAAHPFNPGAIAGAAAGAFGGGNAPRPMPPMGGAPPMGGGKQLPPWVQAAMSAAGPALGGGPSMPAAAPPSPIGAGPQFGGGPVNVGGPAMGGGPVNTGVVGPMFSRYNQLSNQAPGRQLVY